MISYWLKVIYTIPMEPVISTLEFYIYSLRCSRSILVPEKLQQFMVSCGLDIYSKTLQSTVNEKVFYVELQKNGLKVKTQTMKISTAYDF